MSEFNPFSLNGKTILVTGASSGIGRATAILCSMMGASVIITARNEKRLMSTYGELDHRNRQKHSMFLADISVESELDELVCKLPSLDGISLNAGILKTLPIKFINNEDIQHILNVNMIGPALLVQKLLKNKKINKGCSIVFTSSVAGVLTSKVGNTIYGMSKSGLCAFMKGLALELASKKIRSNSVNPGFVQTDFLSKAGAISDDDLRRNLETYPIGRFGKPEDIANAIVFLLSDASSWITGHTLIVDGGMTLQ